MADKKDASFGLDGLFDSLTDLTKLAARLNDLMEEADELQGERTFGDDEGKVKGRVGWSISTLDKQRSIPPNRRQPAQRPTQSYQVRKKSPKPNKSAPQSPQPAIDIFDEGESVLVILDAPIASVDELTTELVAPTILRLSTDHIGTDVNLPRECARVESVTINNGILTVELR